MSCSDYYKACQNQLLNDSNWNWPTFCWRFSYICQWTESVYWCAMAPTSWYNIYLFSGPSLMVFSLCSAHVRVCASGPSLCSGPRPGPMSGLQNALVLRQAGQCMRPVLVRSLWGEPEPLQHRGGVQEDMCARTSRYCIAHLSIIFGFGWIFIKYGFCVNVVMWFLHNRLRRHLSLSRSIQSLNWCSMAPCTSQWKEVKSWHYVVPIECSFDTP